MILWIANMFDLNKTFCHRKQSQTPGELTSFLKEVQLPLIPTVPSGVTHTLSHPPDGTFVYTDVRISFSQ